MTLNFYSRYELCTKKSRVLRSPIAWEGWHGHVDTQNLQSPVVDNKMHRSLYPESCGNCYDTLCTHWQITLSAPIAGKCKSTLFSLANVRALSVHGPATHPQTLQRSASSKLDCNACQEKTQMHKCQEQHKHNTNATQNPFAHITVPAALQSAL